MDTSRTSRSAAPPADPLSAALAPLLAGATWGTLPALWERLAADLAGHHVPAALAEGAAPPDADGDAGAGADAGLSATLRALLHATQLLGAVARAAADAAHGPDGAALAALAPAAAAALVGPLQSAALRALRKAAAGRAGAAARARWARGALLAAVPLQVPPPPSPY